MKTPINPILKTLDIVATEEEEHQPLVRLNEELMRIGGGRYGLVYLGGGRTTEGATIMYRILTSEELDFLNNHYKKEKTGS